MLLLYQSSLVEVAHELVMVWLLEKKKQYWSVGEKEPSFALQLG